MPHQKTVICPICKETTRADNLKRHTDRRHPAPPTINTVGGASDDIHFTGERVRIKGGRRFFVIEWNEPDGSYGGELLMAAQ